MLDKKWRALRHPNAEELRAGREPSELIFIGEGTHDQAYKMLPRIEGSGARIGILKYGEVLERFGA
jgi:hypothetical protein